MTKFFNGGNCASNSSIHFSKILVLLSSNLVNVSLVDELLSMGVATAAPKSNSRHWISMSWSSRPLLLALEYSLATPMIALSSSWSPSARKVWSLLLRRSPLNNYNIWFTERQWWELANSPMRQPGREWGVSWKYSYHGCSPISRPGIQGGLLHSILHATSITSFRASHWILPGGRRPYTHVPNPSFSICVHTCMCTLYMM